MKTRQFSPVELKEFANTRPDDIWAITNDGQGDTDMYQLAELVHSYNMEVDEDEDEVSYYHYMTKLFWEDTNGNMSFFIVIENNFPYRVGF